MKQREIILISVCILFIIGQVYFDLKIPEFINQVTVLATTPGSDIQTILQIGLLMLLCLVASLILSVCCGYLSARTAAGFTFSLRQELFSKVMDFHDEEILKFSIPSLITRTTNDITQIQTLISMGLQIAVKSPILAIWAIFKILGKNWQLSVLTAGFVAAVCASVLIVMVIVTPRFRKIQKLTDKINLVVRENLTGINVVHAFNAEKYQNDKFEVVNDDITSTQLFNQRMFAGLQPIIELSTNCLWFSIYWLGAALLMSMSIPDRVNFFGDIVSFALYANYILVAFMMMIMIFMMYPPAKASGERILEVLDEVEKIKEGNLKITESKEKIMEFKNVSFKYPQSKKDMLKNINFDMKKGETVAIIGSTGCGKTTLVNLMMRFYDVSEGEILFKGKNINEYAFDTLYDSLSLATQKPVIFYGSVKDNITFGEQFKEISDEEVDRAINIAQADDFINKLENGKDTIISQGGKDISGGQKQRISIARSIARNPEILVMDDTFSALDYKTDALLRKSLSEQLKDTTCVIVAQRIGTIRHADKIIVLDNGEITGIGTHQELMESCPTYIEIAISQLKAEELA